MYFTKSDFIQTILLKYAVQGCKPVKKPAEATMNSYADEESFCNLKIPCRVLVGSLLYLLTRARPNIAAAVGVCAQNVEAPKSSHGSR